MNYPCRLAVTEPSQVGEARRAAAVLAARLGFDEAAAGKVALVVTEAANNLVKHARDGELLLYPVEEDRTAGIEILALDKGPGMDLGRCLQDGYSTAGTPGTGLGAIKRLSAFFDLYTRPCAGSALVARLWSTSGFPNGPQGVDVGAVSVPMAGETVCGDAWAVARGPGCHLFLVVDGLGHGPQAAAAAWEAVRIFRDRTGLAPEAILQAMHAALRSTRGAAMALAAVDFEAHELRYAGVGNIAGTIVSDGDSRSMVSHNGTIGHQAPRIQEFLYPFPPGALLVMHSDGLTGHWRLDQYPGLAGAEPSLIAGILYRDFQRGRDDVTVLVARQGAKGGAA